MKKIGLLELILVGAIVTIAVLEFSQRARDFLGLERKPSQWLRGLFGGDDETFDVEASGQGVTVDFDRFKGPTTETGEFARRGRNPVFTQPN